MMTIPLPAPLPPRTPVEINLAFVLRLPQLNLGWWPPQGNFGWGERVTQVGDWCATLVPYREGQGWLVWEYYPVGDPAIYEPATFAAQIKTDADVVVAAPGLLYGESGNWRFRLDGVRTFAFLASREYVYLRGTSEGIAIRSYYLPEYQTAAQAVLDNAAQALTLFTQKYGPYPYQELVIAQNGYYGGMEYPALVSLSNYAYLSYTGDPKELLTSLTVHETSHQWWYGAVGNDQVREPWLDEGLAQYSEAVYFEQVYPDLVAWWWTYTIDYWGPVGPVDRTIYDFTDTETYLHQIYGRGAHLFADLRALMGDEAFFAALLEYRAVNDGRLATADDFFAAVRAHTDVDLTGLMGEYFQYPH
jgi:hypothetical protein